MSKPIDGAIPVTLVAGYLGAGKTTWLNAHLRDGVAPDTLVLVNDFGTINVDAELIDYAGERLLKLSSGCLCCSLSDELGTQLSRIGRWPEPPAALIIETSGIARPQRIADLIRVARRFRLDRIVTLVDLASLAQRLNDSRVGELVAAQIASADRLSLNRGDDLDPAEREHLIRQLQSLNPTAHVVLTGAGVDSSDERTPKPAPARPLTLHPTAKDRDPEWQRFAIALPPSLTRQTLEALLTEHADGLARAKGFIQADGRHYVFQWSGGRAEWTPTAPRSGASQLVGIGFIGNSFDALISALKALT
ncbi:CobW family GTP-binding protein [Chromohalobacter nigrandesensis]|uniref:CobW family GTP-binding protein n=1 Tax=Chromohalobacter nigrandesensis TaxID=119863 RepID=UPI001FF632FD|nr:CobW family GTP-binding protein [Chromohalobacter nigrandesensis]MCK0745901.1 GTP-binding protein [Chromohalobacter nigrandesensis]